VIVRDPDGGGIIAPILIETTFKGLSCLPCVYMEAAVQEVLPIYGGRVAYERIDIASARGKKRFLELSCRLYGETGVYTYHRLAPIPGLFIDGKLVFDAIPVRDELIVQINRYLGPSQSA
jgi:hypothetical protein